MRTHRYAIWLLAALLIGPGYAADAPKSPSPATTQYRTGTELMRMGRWQKAIAALERAAQLAPDRADIQEALGGAYFDYSVEMSLGIALVPTKEASPKETEPQERITKMTAAAEEALKKAVSLDPKNAEYHHSLGWFYLAQYWQHMFDIAAQPAPGSKEANGSAQGNTRPDSEAKPPDYAKMALDEFQAAIRLAPANDDYQRSLADAFRVIGTPDKTPKTDEKPAVENSKDSSKEPGATEPPPKPFTGDRVTDWYQSALKADPNSAILHYELYNYLTKRSRVPSPDALDHLQKARQLDPGSALYGYELARRLFEVGRNPEALNTLRYANLAPRLTLTYYPAYPRRLAAGLLQLQIGRDDLSAFSDLRELARAASMVARGLANYDTRVALSAHDEVVKLGERLALNDDPTARAVGLEIGSMGLHDMLSLATWMGDPQAFEAAQVRQAQLRALSNSLLLAPVPPEDSGSE